MASKDGQKTRPRGLVLEALRLLAKTPHKPIVWGSTKRGWRMGPVQMVVWRTVRRMTKEGWLKPEGSRYDETVGDMIERYSFTPAGRRAYIAAKNSEGSPK